VHVSLSVTICLSVFPSLLVPMCVPELFVSAALKERYTCVSALALPNLGKVCKAMHLLAQLTRPSLAIRRNKEVIASLVPDVFVL
jgi:hypothetical protein